MKLDLLSPSDGTFLYLERYVDEGARTYSPFAGRTEVSPVYQPTSENPSFDVLTVVVPYNRVTVFQADYPFPALRDYYIRPDGVVFPVHPETWNSPGVDGIGELRNFAPDTLIEVVPTASTRTVLALEQPGRFPHHFIKLHYPRRISRFNRRLRRKNIENSIAITRDIGNVQFKKFAYLPDVLGVVFGEGDNGWGFVVRERTPRPFQEERLLVPCFALYANDLHFPGDVPLLVQLIRFLKADPELFLLNEIMIPIVECWTKVVRERGILLESHAQNTLLELSSDLRPQRIVHRDFDVWIDFELRRSIGIDSSSLNSMGRLDAHHPMDRHYSLIYDRFIGAEFFEYLLYTVKRFYSINDKFIRDCVKEAFHQFLPEAEALFPAKTVYYFSNEPKPGHEFDLVDLHQLPLWR